MNTTRNVLKSLAVVVALSVAVLSGCRKAETGPKPFRVAVLSIQHLELIDQIVDGIRKDLGPQLDNRPIEILEKNANGDTTAIGPMIQGVLAQHPDVVVPITTPVAVQALKNDPAAVPTLFCGITDPVGAKLVNSLETPGLSTGVSDVPPLERTLQVIRAMFPKAKSIGMPYSPSEEPAQYSRKEVEMLAPKYGFTLDARAVTSVDELSALARDLTRKNDVVMIGADNQMFSNASLLAKTSLDAHKPFFAADSSSVKAGAVAGVTVSYPEVGKACGEVVKRVLRGEKAGAIPVISLSDGVLEVNARSLKLLGITLPATVSAQVQRTYP
jgi:putative ABC transport system substrate-binding protein